MSSAGKPVVLVPACNRVLGHHPFHIAGKKYIDAVRLTGSPSNVHPSHFDEGVHDPALPLDAERDAWTLPVIPKALAQQNPVSMQLLAAFGAACHSYRRLKQTQGRAPFACAPSAGRTSPGDVPGDAPSTTHR